MKRLLIAPLIGLLTLYRYVISPLLGSNCRFYPSCSVYAMGALRKHGLLTGLRLTIWRVLRCNPWCAGGHDPVP
ncbi:membrane protein insertion efficiency factor YidD [Uliginosibacterium gangwonense]|uniref:membrane protein insertion efficiency factor YidD n=1 Tax=Uliginosibacterium gangwonense TaxID=392736 RepID=UPI0003AA8D0E|nr:membrane protein insertion efficiency factor YidD [Uliginosibacterium gangwonense]